MSQREVKQAREVPRFRPGDPIKAADMNVIGDEVRRLSSRVAMPPTQLPARRVTGGAATVGVGDPMVVGYTRFFSS